MAIKEKGSKNQEQDSSLDKISELRIEIENLTREVITAEQAGQIPNQYFTGKIEAITKLNPKATVFLSTIKAFFNHLISSKYSIPKSLNINQNSSLLEIK